MGDSKVENKGLKFDLAKALEATEGEESVQDDNLDLKNQQRVMSPPTALSKEIILEHTESYEKVKEENIPEQNDEQT